MSVRKREGNRPDRRLIKEDLLSHSARKELCEQSRYVGSGNHKLHPGNYGFRPSHNPRPSKSPCDAIRTVLREEASALMRQGIMLGMVSQFDGQSFPKYIWAVDRQNDVYEAKTRPERTAEYHGYRLGDDEHQMREYILEEWNRRCPKS